VSLKSLVGRSVESLDTPVVLVDFEALDRNISRMATTIIKEAGVGWRPHTKSMKSAEIAQLCLTAGAHGVTCAKLGEAEVMADGGITDILVANQIVGSTKIKRLVDLCRRADPIVCVDNIETTKAIDEAAGARGVRPRILIEVNVGMNRAGVPPADPTVELAKQIAALRNVRFSGLQTWESHALAATNQAEKRRLVSESLRAFTDTAARIRESGIPVEIVSCGGTGTYWISAFEQGITEIEAGGGIFCDLHYRNAYGVDLEFAMTVLATVTSRPTSRLIVCDAGFKTSGKGFGNPELIGYGAVEAVRISAEHGSFTLREAAVVPRVGDKIRIIPAYSDATVFLHEYLYGVRDGRVVAVWPILGRGRLQ
jgi:D-serine deaminase-like pyridoxal phosphate-dependent protein